MASFWSDKLVTFIDGVQSETPVIGKQLLHEHIIKGNCYLLTRNRISINAGSGDNLLVQTDSNTTTYLIFNYYGITNVNTNFHVRFHRGSTIGDIGTTTDISQSNMNFNSSKTGSFIFRASPTVTDYGTYVFVQLFTADSGAGIVNTIFKLDKGENYVIRSTNYGSNTSDFSFGCILVEIDDE